MLPVFTDSINYEYVEKVPGNRYLDMVKEIKFKGSKYQTEKYVETTDAFGNPLKEVVNAPNDTDIPVGNRMLTTERTWSADGRYMLTEKNPAGFVSTFTYYPETGFV